MFKFLQMYLRIQAYKWLIEWHQKHADAATVAYKIMGDDKENLSEDVADAVKNEWYNRWGYHMDRMKEIEEKLEKI